jgi:hypothetical protein
VEVSTRVSARHLLFGHDLRKTKKTGAKTEPLTSAKAFDPTLQVGFCMFQHGAALGVLAALQLLDYVSERQSKALFFA